MACWCSRNIFKLTSLLAFFSRPGWMRSMVMIQKLAIQLWLTPSLQPWRGRAFVWTTHALISAARLHLKSEPMKSPSSSHTVFSWQKAKYEHSQKHILLGFTEKKCRHVATEAFFFFVLSLLKFVGPCDIFKCQHEWESHMTTKSQNSVMH